MANEPDHIPGGEDPKLASLEERLRAAQRAEEQRTHPTGGGFGVPGPGEKTGQRVISTTAFRCVGNVLSLHGRLYSPPYVIRAIGDPKKLRTSLYASPQIQVYLQYVDAVGLGWSVNSSTALTLPAYEGTTDLQYASVPAGIDVLASTADGSAPSTSGAPAAGPTPSSPTSTTSGGSPSVP